MKGTVIDFSNTENSGLILGEDGNRYIFDISDYKGKNKSIDIDCEVDFIVDENIAKEIYPIKIKESSKEAIKIEKDEKTPTSSSLNIKKVDFKSIENELSNPKHSEAIQKEYKIYLILSILVLLIPLYIMFTAKTSNSGIFVLSMLASLFIAFYIVKLFLVFSSPYEVVKKMVLKKSYKEQLKIWETTPKGLEYEEIRRLHIEGKSFENSEEQLLELAFNIKADAIINYSYQHSTSSNIKTSGFGKHKSIDTKINEYHIIDGLAIRFL